MRSKSVESMIRVDHAGEYAAVCIYHGQGIVFSRTQDADKIQEMQEHERVHFGYFNNLILQRRVRPTLFLPVWHVAGVALGYVTAMMGKEAAMACTAAVEEVICDHYNGQVAQLDDSERDLSEKILQFCAEEREHMETAIDCGAEKAFGYKLLSSAIKMACRAGIAISKVL
ncbi:ubiquinone biosynthesis protein [Anaplasma marginale str. Dawn]|nr:demethoxyubiquinone hydroxylase family protein [Anaplasma marginale]AGZ78696.1 ubiquinone biosynthesis protein [Anaplasma marginale str. Gypsy Plains]AGZ79540.1 ubiquinone biosynthesis protein [Anaplasma marginale str. Dawn]AXW83887.1 demethoxyubiquinone hydroxylase family protein [Anaplasma marginale]AXW84806.1 demethoxyubiquinone hydroxylase family protein [Anaplasma marginale]KAA8473062.1 demethoxyubiquinone hydroxylase family protein [Anaplasma marginale]